jgi:anaerobic ribonucleoside-triphosphate reductase activating protein
MRYSQIIDFDVNNGDGIRVSLWTQGCEFKCRGCHNPHTWSKSGGKRFDEESEAYLFSLMDKDIEKNLSILGGEPLAPYNRIGTIELCKNFKKKFPHKTIWLWTGYTIEEIQDTMPELLLYVDVLIDGQYIESLKDENLMWRGSSNQRIHKLR